MPNDILNGVPVTDCLGLINAVASDPQAGQTKWKSITHWRGGFQCESEIRGHFVSMDEPELLGGTNTAPNMVETVLAAYGSCLTVGYTMNASLRGIEISSLSIEVEGDLDLAGFFGLSEQVLPGFSGVRAIVHLEADASPEDLEDLHNHVLRTSPVGSILTNALPLKTELVTNPQPVDER